MVSASKAKRLAKRAAAAEAAASGPSSSSSAKVPSALPSDSRRGNNAFDDDDDDEDLRNLAIHSNRDDGDGEEEAPVVSKKASSRSANAKSNAKNAASAEDIDSELASSMSSRMSLHDGSSSKKQDKENESLYSRTVVGILASLPSSRDIRVESFSLSAYSKKLLAETTVELNFGRRYGFVGANGCGKSIFLRALAAREVPLPDHIDVYLLAEPAPKAEVTATDFVLEEARKELARLEDEAETILAESGDPEDTRVLDLYERIDAMDPVSFHSRVSWILKGLGFDEDMLQKHTADMSGGWRMRVALAKALFLKPTLLLLDDPTAHLDLGACVWLEEYLRKYDRILVVVSHSYDFLNSICTNMIDMRDMKLIYYGGNYDSYVKTRTEQEANQMKQYQKQQDEIAHIRAFIASCGVYANKVRQAKSKQKIIDKMEAEGLIEKVVPEKVFTFRFPDMPKLPPPVLGLDNVTFGYTPDKILYRNITLGIDMDSRIALVGPNGVGKSTLLKLLIGTEQPLDGRVQRHSSLKIGVYSQHSAEQLDDSLSALEFMKNRYPHVSQDLHYWRQTIGRYGLVKDAQTAKIGTLSDGQRARIVFAMLAVESPHILLLDEPANYLTVPTIDSLAEAINAYTGGVVVVSHDFRLVDKVAKDILVCENQTISRWDGDIFAYKKALAAKMMEL